MLQKRYHLLLLIVWGAVILASKSVVSQTLTFAKTEVEQDPNKLYFNVLQIKNESEGTESYSIRINYPEGSKSVGFIPRKATVNPGETKYIPVRIQLSAALKGNTFYDVTASVSNKKGDTREISSQLKLKPKYAISIESDVRLFYFTQVQKLVETKIKIINNGNVEEVLSIGQNISNEITGSRLDDFGKQIRLGVADTAIIRYSVTVHKQFRKESFDNAQLNVFISSSKEDEELKFRFVKILSEFDYRDLQGGVPDNKVELFVRQNDLEVPSRLGVRARGKYVGEKGNLVYRFVSNDIFTTSDFLENNFVDLSYESDLLSFGFGSSSTSLAEGLFKRNSVFVDKTFKIGKSALIHSFANSSITEVDAGAALGYEFSNKTIETTNSVSYNYNEKESNSVASVVNNSTFNFLNSSIDYRGVGVLSQNLLLSQESFNAYEHTLGYTGNYLENKLRFKASNDFRIVEQNIGGLKYNRTYVNGQYSFGRKWMLTMVGNSSIYDNQTSSSDFYNALNSARSMIYFPKIGAFSLGLGLNYEHGNRSLGSENEKEQKIATLIRTNVNYYKVKNTNTVEYGSKKFAYPFTPGDYIKINSRFTYNPLRNTQLISQVTYSQGEVVRFSSIKTKELRANAGVRQTFLDDRLGIDCNLSYLSSERYNSRSLSLSGGINYRTPNYFNVKLNVRMRKTNTSPVLGITTIEASVAKYFNIGDSKHRSDLRLIFFKDANSNGIVDENEETIEGIQVYLSSADNEKNAHSMALVSDSRGECRCANLPKGAYSMELVCMKDLEGFYNFNSNSKIIISNDLDLYVPYSKAGKIYGNLSVIKTKFSAVGLIDVANIRVTATDKDGKKFSGLTDRLGNFTIYVPQNRKYTVAIKEIFGSKFQLVKNNIEVDFVGVKKSELNFVVKEKTRRINFSR